jgi:hypothetical protein
MYDVAPLLPHRVLAEFGGKVVLFTEAICGKNPLIFGTPEMVSIILPAHNPRNLSILLLIHGHSSVLDWARAESRLHHFVNLSPLSSAMRRNCEIGALNKYPGRTPQWKPCFSSQSG